mgnify:CR=1 FL=1
MELREILTVILTSAAPIGELRLSIPLAMVTFNFTWYQAMAIGFLGNLIPVIVLPWILSKLGHVMLELPNPVRNIIIWRTKTLEKFNSTKLQIYGPVALIPFVVIPLPITGVWSASLAAWILDVPPSKSIPL